MARCRYQSGCLFVRGKRRKVWVARWREEVILADGSISRVLRSEVLGPKSLIPSQAEARKLLDARIRPINHGLHRPQAALPFSTFVVQHFEPGVLPTLKFSTQSATPGHAEISTPAFWQDDPVGNQQIRSSALCPRQTEQRICSHGRRHVISETC